MLAARPPQRRPVGGYQARKPLDVAWRLTWPFLVSTIIACAMIICFIIIGALEIASLAKNSTTYYGNTSSTGAGFWCGIFFLIAAVIILLIG